MRPEDPCGVRARTSTRAAWIHHTPERRLAKAEPAGAEDRAPSLCPQPTRGGGGHAGLIKVAKEKG
jgi:hypothetical protein